MGLADMIRAVVQFSTVARSTSSGHGDAMTGRTPPGETPNQIPVRRMWPFGIRSVPPVGIDCAVVKANAGPNNGIMVGAESAKYGPSDLVEGETAIYSKENPKALHADADGATRINAKATKDVIVNGGTRLVVLDTDHVNCGTLAITFVPATPSLSIVYTPPFGSPQTVNDVGTITLVGQVISSAQNFRGV
jgi:phage gp45-like